ncbi:MAG: AMP-binding protein [Gammaproteobacteria bacterium]|nr:AMP-binding protein [Gammaproteobacteria bacterium]
MDATWEAAAAAYRIREKPRGGHKVRVFAENHAYLSQVFKCLETYGEREFIVHEDVRLTFAECRTQAARLAHHLANQCAVEPGDRIGLVLPNSPEWMLSFIAISAIGAVPALINARAGADEVNHCLSSTQCRLCIHQRNDLAAEVDELTLAGTRHILSGQGDHPLPETPRGPDDEALLMFTSGTTGLPKGASLSHEGVLTALKTIEYSGALIVKGMAEAFGIDYGTLAGMRPPPVNLLIFPLFHVSGCHAVFLTSLLQGGKVVLMTRWNAKEAAALMARERVTAFPAVPTMHRDLLRLETLTEHDLSSLTSLSVGGQATPPALLADIHRAFPSAVMGTGYGMTESNGTVTLMIGSEFIDNPRSAGHPVSTVDVEVRDDQGQALPANTTGEIHIRGSTLMTGYVLSEGQAPRAPQAEGSNTEHDAFDADGWFATGDLGYLDEDGLVYIVDRKTDMVISGGENIYCAEVERVMDQHPGVRESAAFGLPDERLGEKLVATVVPLADADLTEAALIDHCVSRLAKHKAPKQVRIQYLPLPRNASGKTIKAQVKQDYLASQ